MPSDETITEQFPFAPRVETELSGEYMEVTPEVAAQLASQGQQVLTDQDLGLIQEAEAKEKKKYAGVVRGTEAAAAGAARGLTFGLSDEALVNLGVDPETLTKLKYYRPEASVAGEIIGVAAPLILTGGAAAPAEAGVVGAGTAARVGLRTAAEFTAPKLIARTGQFVEKLTAKALEKTGSRILANKIVKDGLSRTVGSAAEGVFYSTGQIVSEHALGDPDLNAEKIFSQLKTGALYGGAFGIGGSILSGAGGKIFGRAEVGVAGKVEKVFKQFDGVAPQTRKAWLDVADGGGRQEIKAIHELAPEAPEQAIIMKVESQAVQDSAALNKFLTTYRSERKAILTGADQHGVSGEIGDVVETIQKRVPKIGAGKGPDPDQAAVLNEADEYLSRVVNNAKVNYINDKVATGLTRQQAEDTLNSFIAEQGIGKLRLTASELNSEKMYLGKRAKYDKNNNKIPKTDLVAQLYGDANRAMTRTLYGNVKGLREVNAKYSKFANLVNRHLGKYGFTNLERSLDDQLVAVEIPQINAEKYGRLLLSSPLMAKRLEQYTEAFDDLVGTQTTQAIRNLRAYKDLYHQTRTATLLQKALANIPILGKLAVPVMESAQFKQAMIEAMAPITQHVGAIREGVERMAPQAAGAAPGVAVPGSRAQGLLSLMKPQKLLQPIKYAGLNLALSTEAERKAMLLGSMERYVGDHDKARDKYINRVIEDDEDEATPLPSSLGILAKSGIGEAVKDRFEMYKNHLGELARLYASPEIIATNIGRALHEMSEVASQTTSSLIVTATNAINYLYSMAPKNPHPDVLYTDREWKPTDRELSTYERRLEAVTDPLSVLKDLKNGTITPEKMQTLKAVHPRIYDDMRQRAVARIAETQAKLSYKQRIRLGAFLGLPIDTSMQPKMISRLQATYEAKQAEGQPLVGGGAIRPTAKGMDKLGIADRMTSELQRTMNRRNQL